MIREPAEPWQLCLPQGLEWSGEAQLEQECRQRQSELRFHACPPEASRVRMPGRARHSLQ